MLESLARYLCGSMLVKAEGEGRRRFLNMAVKSGLNFWDYGFDEESFSFRVNMFRGQELKRIAAKTGAKISFSDRRGLPLRLKFFLRRPGIALGAVLAVITISFLSDRIWVLSTSGSELYSREEIFAAAEELGVFIGADYDDFDPVSAGRLMMLKLPEVSWVSINNDGIFTEILLKDREKPPEMEESSQGIWNIVASKPGVIVSVEAKEGLPTVKKGDVVMPGDLCVTGIWQNKYGYTFLSPSYGKVMAQVQENFSVTVPDRETVLRELETVTKRHLEVFGLKIPLSLSHGDFELSSSETRERKLTLLGMELPIIYSETKITRLEENIRFLSQREMEQEALRQLETLQRAYGREGQLLWQEKEISFSEGFCRLKSESFFLMDIGRREEVLVDERILANQYKTE